MRILLAATMAAAVLMAPGLLPARALSPGAVPGGSDAAQAAARKHVDARAGIRVVRTGEKEPSRRKAGQRDGKAAHGFLASCQWLRARALTSHNPAWWRKYRDCVAR